MNEIVPAQEIARARRSITVTMAHRFGMEPDPFMATLEATVFSRGMSREEKAAFLLVADHHNLNPVTREIYAMPKKGGGIIPVVSIDGWVRMCNEHRAFDGMEFEFEHAGEKLVSATCKIYRKDRSHPIVVTEYLSECKRETEPWKMEHRMLRHKSMIQCSRYAFGFAGIYDQDEAERFAASPAPEPRRVAPSPSAPQIELQPERAQEQPVAAAEKPAERRRAPSAAEQPEKPQTPPADAPFDPEKVRARFAEALKTCKTIDQINDAWMQIVDPVQDDMFPSDREDLEIMVRTRTGEIAGDAEWSES